MEISKTDIKFKVYDRGNQIQLKPVVFYIRPDRLRFSNSTMKLLGMNTGESVVFIEIDDWYLCNVAATGIHNGKAYKLQKDTKRAGFSISASVIARSILRKIAPGKDRCECALEETNYEYHGNKMYKIVSITRTNI